MESFLIRHHIRTVHHLTSPPVSLPGVVVDWREYEGFICYLEEDIRVVPEQALNSCGMLEACTALILNVGSSCRWAVCQLHEPAVSPPGKKFSYPLNRRLDAPHVRSVAFGEEKNFLPLPGIELWLLRCSPHQLVMYWLSYSSSVKKILVWFLQIRI
jgi:hypothetical protein